MASDLRVLVIDDLRVARNSVLYPATYARTPRDGIEQLENNEWDLIFLDHDLGFNFTEGELTIWPCIDYILENQDKFKDTMFTVISSSPRAGAMVQNLETYGFNVDRWTLQEVSTVFKTLDN